MKTNQVYGIASDYEEALFNCEVEDEEIITILDNVMGLYARFRQGNLTDLPRFGSWFAPHAFVEKSDLPGFMSWIADELGLSFGPYGGDLEPMEWSLYGGVSDVVLVGVQLDGTDYVGVAYCYGYGRSGGFRWIESSLEYVSDLVGESFWFAGQGMDTGYKIGVIDRHEPIEFDNFVLYFDETGESLILEDIETQEKTITIADSPEGFDLLVRAGKAQNCVALKIDYDAIPGLYDEYDDKGHGLMIVVDTGEIEPFCGWIYVNEEVVMVELS